MLKPDKHVPDFLKRRRGEAPRAAELATTPAAAAARTARPYEQYIRSAMPDRADEILARDAEAARKIFEEPTGQEMRSSTKKKNFFAKARETAADQKDWSGRTWIPGASWDVRRNRWVHPGMAARTKIAAQTEEKKIVSKKEKKEPATRDVSQPAGLVSEFKQVRDGTARATVVKMAGRASGASVEDVTKAIKGDRKTLLMHLFCMKRDCAYGYAVTGDKVVVTFPGSKTAKDAIKEAAGKKAA